MRGRARKDGRMSAKTGGPSVSLHPMIGAQYSRADVQTGCRSDQPISVGTRPARGNTWFQMKKLVFKAATFGIFFFFYPFHVMLLGILFLCQFLFHRKGQIWVVG